MVGGRGARATIEVHHFCSEVPHFRSSRHVLLDPKTNLEKNKTNTGDKKSNGLGIQRESCKKQGLFRTILGYGAPSFRNNSGRKVPPLSWHASGVLTGLEALGSVVPPFFPRRTQIGHVWHRSAR